MLSLPQVQDVCLYFTKDSNTCRYLSKDEQMGSKFYCLKHRPLEKAKIDSKLSTFTAECAKKKIDPHDMNESMGDNCAGYTYLKHKLQGYDVDKNP